MIFGYFLFFFGDKTKINKYLYWWKKKKIYFVSNGSYFDYKFLFKNTLYHDIDTINVYFNVYFNVKSNVNLIQLQKKIILIQMIKSLINNFHFEITYT